MFEESACSAHLQDGQGHAFNMVVMAYIDETGDTGDPALKGSSSCYALGCVLVDLDQWPSAFERLVEFRRSLRADYGIPMRQELKANYLIRNNGGLRPLGLSDTDRHTIYARHLELLAALPAEGFGIVLDKQLSGYTGRACFETTWQMLLQRLERMCSYESKRVMISHDAGENDAIRRIVRRSRRHLTAGAMQGGGGFTFKAEEFLDDPIPRDSAQSYFIQIADMLAYSAWRTYMRPSPSVARIVDSAMWERLGTATRSAVNSLKLNGSVPGVVLRTR